MEMQNGVLKSDYDALVALYNSTGGDGWERNYGWMTEKPVNEWFGVNVDNGRVVELSLYGNRLTGMIPPQIGNLVKLTVLSLHKNNLTGMIPPEIGNLAELTVLTLSDNQLTGGIPESVNLPNCKIYI